MHHNISSRHLQHLLSSHQIIAYKYETHGLSILSDWVWNMLKPLVYREGIFPAPECASLLCPVDINSETQ